MPDCLDDFVCKESSEELCVRVQREYNSRRDYLGEYLNELLSEMYD